MLNWQKVEELVSLGYISKRKHPEYPIYILNYTPKTQWEFFWTKETVACRGLIIDQDYNILAIPWKKFFSLEQYEDPRVKDKFEELFDIAYDNAFDNPVQVTNKIDGSLIIGFWYIPENKFILASRGSFESDQSVWARNIYQQKYSEIPIHYHNTYVFEVIYPENRIVVDYKGRTDIILLGVIDNATGKDKNLLDFVEDDWQVVEEARFASAYTPIKDIKSTIPDGSEGYVIKYANGLRMKVKSDEYIRLHRLMTNMTPKIVLQYVKCGNLGDLANILPDEFYQTVLAIAAPFNQRYEEILDLVDTQYCCGIMLSRKDLALSNIQFPYRNILFAKLDQKNFTNLIWKHVEREML